MKSEQWLWFNMALGLFISATASLSPHHLYDPLVGLTGGVLAASSAFRLGMLYR